MARSTYIRPFLKWAGGKYRVLPHIVPRLPKARRLLEPFLGSGVVALNTEYDEYLLADINPDLISVYQHLQTQGEDFIRYARSFFHEKHNQPERYYALRERFNAEHNARAKAALFLYLNRHGYNGLCRYNASGGFNVPFGRYKQPYFPADEMRHFMAKADRVTLQCSDFSALMKQGKRGDVIYCDPPYVALSRTANFVGYAKTGFNDAEQTLLAQLAESLRKKGATVLISNHDTVLVRELYKRSELHHFSVQRAISCNGARRERAAELLAIYD